MKFSILVAFVAVSLTAGQGFDLKSIENLVSAYQRTLTSADADFRPMEDVFVTIRNGTLRGNTGVSTNNSRTIYRYKKIPYARPPVGELRFQPPQPLVDGWGDEIYDATENPPACPQYLTALTPASEDCLFVNVYTPKAPNDTAQKLPVMFFIHGGGFVLGDSVIYGPARILQEDVVLVVVHYRLGALGFLSTEDSVVPGNNGMKDMVQALRWVQENIEAFGGDPNQVTIFGESAGGAAVTYLLISPLATGLFHRVLAQSGTPLSPWARDAHPLQSAQRIGRHFNCSIESSIRLVDCLRQRTWEELAEFSFLMLIGDIVQLKLNFDAAAPVIEPDFPGAFLTKDPYLIMRDGPIPDVPLILGAVQHEGSAILGAAYALNWSGAGVIDDPFFVREDMLPTLLKAIGTDELETGGAPISQGLALAFLPQPRPDNFTLATNGMVDMLSVALFKAPIQRTADLLSRHLSNIYLYSFEHEGFNTLWTLLFDLLGAITGSTPPPIQHGVMHGDDLHYLFTLPAVIIGNDRTFSDNLVKIWTDFAKTGNPTPDSSAPYPAWPAYNIANSQYYRLVLNPEVQTYYPASWRKGFSN